MKNRIIIAALCLFASGTLSAQSVYPGQHRGKIEKETVAPLQVKSFDLKDIRLLPSRFRENMMRDSAWMASIDVNRLLHSFRTNAGVFAGREGGYMTVKKLGGWESCLMLTLKSNNDEEFCLYPTSLSILAFNRMR